MKITNEMAEKVIRKYARLTTKSHIVPRRIERMKAAIEEILIEKKECLCRPDDESRREYFKDGQWWCKNHLPLSPILAEGESH